LTLLDDLTEFGIDLGLILAVTALADEGRRAADKTTVLVAPLDNFQVARGGGLHFALFHGFNSSTLRQRRCGLQPNVAAPPLRWVTN
jgi:hypothetical protein